MSSWTQIPIGKTCYQPRSGTSSIERLINLYAQPSNPDAKSAFVLYGTPGLLEWTDIGDGPIRGLHRANGYIWVVSGDTLYALNESTKTPLTIGGVNQVGPVRMIHNSTHVVVCTSVEAYAATTSGMTSLPEIDLISATYQDGYGVYVQRNTEFLWLSGLDDLTDIPAADFTSADAFPDNVIAVISHQRNLWVFGGSTVEVYSNTGNASFPFERVPGGVLERGCASPGSVAKGLTHIYWLGDDRRVYRAAGFVEEAVSTHDIDRLIADAYSPETAEAFTYTQDGHTFYVLTFADLTLVYDITTGLWHERRSYGLNRWRAQGHTQIGSKHLVGDYDDGKIYELDLATYDEGSDPIEWQIVFPPLSIDPNPILAHGLFLDVEAGVGLTSGQGSDPVVLLSWSDDDGRTWSNDVEASVGKIGEYRRRATFNRLGKSQNRSFRVRGSDPVKRSILAAAARIEAGALS